MWPFDSQSARRKEIRRAKIERTGPWYRRLVTPGTPSAFVVAIISALAIGTIINLGEEPLELREGKSLPSIRAARVAFEIPDAERTQEMRLRARDASPTYYKLDETLLEDIRGRLLNLVALAKTNGADDAALIAAANEAKLSLSPAAADELQAVVTQERESAFVHSIENAIGILRNQPLVETDPAAAKRTAAQAVLLESAATERPIPAARLAFASPETIAATAEAAARQFGEPLRNSIRDSIANLLRGTGQPRGLYRFDPERTETAAADAYAAVPMQFQKYAPGSALADAGPISHDELRILQAEHDQYELELREKSQMQWRARFLARFALVLVVIVGVSWYTARHEQVIESRLSQRLLTSAVLIAIFAVARWALVADMVPLMAIVGAQPAASSAVRDLRPGNRDGCRRRIGRPADTRVGSGSHKSAAAARRNRHSALGPARCALPRAHRAHRPRGRGRCGRHVGRDRCGANGETLRYSANRAAWAAGATLLAALVIEEDYRGDQPGARLPRDGDRHMCWNGAIRASR